MNDFVLNRIRGVLPLLVVIILCATQSVWAKESINTDKTGVAVSGYDVVAYFKSGKPMKGNFQIAFKHEGATYRFASKENLESFKSNPKRYLPAYGGYCAYGVSVGQKFYADPTVWKIVNGRLYLNLDQNIAKLFEKNLQGNIRKADKNWTQIAEKPAGKS